MRSGAQRGHGLLRWAGAPQARGGCAGSWWPVGVEGRCSAVYGAVTPLQTIGKLPWTRDEHAADLSRSLHCKTLLLLFTERSQPPPVQQVKKKPLKQAVFSRGKHFVQMVSPSMSHDSPAVIGPHAVVRNASIIGSIVRVMVGLVVK